MSSVSKTFPKLRVVHQLKITGVNYTHSGVLYSQDDAESSSQLEFQVVYHTFYQVDFEEGSPLEVCSKAGSE
jgi:hypothetical protein